MKTSYQKLKDKNVALMQDIYNLVVLGDKPIGVETKASYRMDFLVQDNLLYGSGVIDDAVAPNGLMAWEVGKTTPLQYGLNYTTKMCKDDIDYRKKIGNTYYFKWGLYDEHDVLIKSKYIEDGCKPPESFSKTTSMTYEEYEEKITALERQQDIKRHKLVKQYVDANNPHKIGDTVTHKDGNSIVIERMEYSGLDIAIMPPCAIYYGLKLREDNTPIAGYEISIYQSSLINQK